MSGRGGFIVVGCLLVAAAVFVVLFLVMGFVVWPYLSLVVLIAAALAIASNFISEDWKLGPDLGKRLAAWWRMDERR